MACVFTPPLYERSGGGAGGGERSAGEDRQAFSIGGTDEDGTGVLEPGMGAQFA